MPIYEYKCNACNKDFELLVMGSFKPQCPSCKSQDLSRLMSCCGFVSKAPGAGNETQVTSSSSSSCASCTSSNCSSCGIG